MSAASAGLSLLQEWGPELGAVGRLEVDGQGQSGMPREEWGFLRHIEDLWDRLGMLVAG